METLHVLVAVLVVIIGANTVAVNLIVGPKVFVVTTGAGVIVLVGALVFAGRTLLLVTVFVVVVFVVLVVVESGVLVTVTYQDNQHMLLPHARDKSTHRNRRGERCRDWCSHKQAEVALVRNWVSASII